jgi:hypothetical protein
MRRLLLVSAVLVGWSSVAGSAELDRPQLQPPALAALFHVVKFAPAAPDLSPFAPHGAAMPRESLPAAEPGAQMRIRMAARCGTTNYYCNPPTPVCCGTPGKYYCARDASGCNRE